MARCFSAHRFRDRKSPPGKELHKNSGAHRKMASLAGLCRAPSMVNSGENDMTTYSIVNTSFGELALVANGTELIGVYFYDCRHVPAALKTWTRDDANPLLKKAGKEINDYLDGKRSTFTFSLGPVGTDFQKKIWKEIAKIPFG